MKNVIIDPGIIPLGEILHGLKDADIHVSFIQRKEILNEIIRKWPEIKSHTIYCYTDFDKINNKLSYNKVCMHYNYIYDSILSDYRTHLISERAVFRIKPWQNCHNDLELLDILVTNFIQLLHKESPAFIFFQAAPHDIYSWLLGKVAELLNIPVYMSKLSVLPWKSVLVRGLDAQQLVDVDYGTDIRENEKYVSNFYLLNKKDYREAIPYYEKDRLTERKGKFWSWKAELKEPLRRPHRFVALFRKYGLYKYYQSLAIRDIVDKNYIVVFLHYQPERTSLPEGLQFANQLHLIRTLQLACPDYKIYVKEHPSMFTGHLDIRYRDKRFYRYLSEMDNVELVDIRTDTFNLLDNALCLVTITGTVGIQAIIRGKSVLCCGPSTYVGLHGVYLIKDCADVKRTINFIAQQRGSDYEEELSKTTLSEMFLADKQSASGILDDEEMPNLYNDYYRLVSNSIVLKHLLFEKP